MKDKCPKITTRNILVAALLCTATLLHADEKAEHILDRSSATLAATLALGKLSQTIAQAPADDNLLYSKMTSSPADYTDPIKAEELLKPIFAKEISDGFANDAVQMLTRLADGKDTAELFGAEFITGATNAPQELIENLVSKNYRATFQKARRRACKEQAARLAAKVSPTEIEVDTLSKERLTDLMATRVAQTQNEPVFQENIKYIGDAIVKPMLEEAYNQRGTQKALARTCSVSGIAPSTIATNILKHLSATIQAKKESAKEGETVYNIFPSVKAEAVPQAAEEKTIKMLDQRLAETAVPLDINALAKEISSNPQKHHTLNDSRKAFQQGLSAKMTEIALQTILSQTQPNEKSEVQAFGKSHFESGEVSKKLNQRIAKELDITLAPLRNAFAELQFKENFPTLNDKRWYPDQPLVDHVVESNDFRKILKKWHKIDGLKEFANVGQNKPLLEETIKLLDIAIVNSFEPGAAALHSQHTIVKDLLNEVKVQFQKENSKPDLNRIIELYTKSVIRKWDESKDKTLPKEILEARIYDNLFPSTQRLIALMAKTILDSLNEPIPEEEEKPKPPENTPQPPPEELKEIEMNCRLVFSRAHEEIEIEVFIDGKKTARHTCPYAPTSYRKKMSDFTGKAAHSVSEIVQEATKNNRVALKIMLDVQDPLVYYSAVSDVSWILKTAIESLGEYITKYEVSENR